MKIRRLKSSVIFVLIPLIAGAVSIENFWGNNNDNLDDINGRWEWVGSFAGVPRYQVFPEKGKKRFLEAIKDNVLVFDEDGRIISSGAVSDNIVTFQEKDDVRLQREYAIRNDSLFFEEYTGPGAGASPIVSIYVRKR
ncbi:hypothetical protein [Maribellus sp. YY47]|uniref:hypothetical protein n=1 Tax=Maribellus sp. YY47 TaxID=2929486 RepID=UPI002000B77F|nr:hypothetical protein [Maribellus sp. YY47]MCK3684673.1 hypothetical protein [Maribellus sp. YY47]